MSYYEDGMMNATSTKPSSSTALVMIVDDSSAVRQQFSLALKTINFDAIGFEDAETALSHVGLIDHGISAAILDYRLPGIDGISLARKLRAHDNWKDTPILMCSTTTDQATLRKAKSAGVNGWAVKPFQPRPFLKTLVTLISEHQTKRS